MDKALCGFRSEVDGMKQQADLPSPPQNEAQQISLVLTLKTWAASGSFHLLTRDEFSYPGLETQKG